MDGGALTHIARGQWVRQADGGTVGVSCQSTQPFEARELQITAVQVESIDS